MKGRAGVVCLKTGVVGEWVGGRRMAGCVRGLSLSWELREVIWRHANSDDGFGWEIYLSCM